MKPVLVTLGEPAGVGPDIILALAGRALPAVILGDAGVLRARAEAIASPLHIIEYTLGTELDFSVPNTLHVIHVPFPKSVVPGQLDPENARTVLQILDLAAMYCAQDYFSAVVTAPVHKGVINDAGIAFSGHTEYFAEYFHVPRVLMLMVAPGLRLALATTHIPLADVPASINKTLLHETLILLRKGLQEHFSITEPHIAVSGLNPHAGEGGHLGREEVEIIEPAVQTLRDMGFDITGPFPADTLFVPGLLSNYDAVLTMYHDQGLTVLKHMAFDEAVNMTLGLPIIRTSVDHGTALSIAGSGKANPGSLIAAVNLAVQLAMLSEERSYAR